MQHSIKKFIRIFALLALCASLLVGCVGLNEISMYRIIREIDQFESIQIDGEISYDSTGTELYDMFANDVLDNESMKKLVNSSKLMYSLKTNRKTNQTYMNFYIVDKTTAVQQPITTVIFDGVDIYLNAQDLLKFVKDNKLQLQEDIAAMEESLEDNIYLRIVGNPLYNTYDVSLEDLSEQEQFLENLTDRFMSSLESIFSNFPNKLVDKTGNKYIIQKDLNEIIDITAETILYVVDNLNVVETEMNSFIDTISQEEYDDLLTISGLDGYENSTLVEFKDEFKTEISETVELARADKEMTKTAVDEYRDLVKQDLQDAGIENLVYETSVEKKYVGLYEISNTLSGTIKNGDFIETQNGKDLTFSLNHIATISDLGKGYKVVIPTEKVMTFEIEEPQYETAYYLTVSLDDGGYLFESDYEYLDEGELPVIVKDGSTYLPLRFIGESFGETVGWDQTTSTPYVMQDGHKVYMKGLVQNGKSYIKIRDFEKLGYWVYWDEEYNEVVIIK